MDDTQSSPLKQILSSKLILIGAGVVILSIIVISGVFFFLRSEQKAELEPIPEGSVYSPNEITIKLKEEYLPAPSGENPQWDALYTKLQNLGVIGYEKVFESDSSDLQYHYKLLLEDGASIEQIRSEIYRLNEIESAEPDYILSTQATVNDPNYPVMWHLPKIQMENAWNIQTGSSGVSVAVVDTGIDYSHEDFAGRTIIKGKDVSTCDSTLDQLTASGGSCSQPKSPDADPMDTNGHGTHVAGTIGAVSNNSTGIAGINWDVTLIGVKVLGRGGAGGIPDIANGIVDAADRGAKIINMSLGGKGTCSPGSAIRSSVEYAQSKGALLVVAAGNNNGDASQIAPANCPGVMVIGATGPNDERASYSNYGSVVSLAAPGGNRGSQNCSSSTCVTSTWLNNGYVPTVGTSMSTPHVAGVAALLLAQNSGFTADQLKSCLINSADSITTDMPIGGKRLNAYNALNSCSDDNTTSTVTPTTTNSPTSTLSPSPIVNQQNSYYIRGIVYDDKNKNGKRDTDEGTLQGVTVKLKGKTTQSSVTTGNDGVYLFNDLEGGQYRVESLIGNTALKEYRFSLTNQLPNIYLSSAIKVPETLNNPSSTPGVNLTSGTPSPTQAPLFSCKEKITSRQVNNKNIQVKYLECTPK
jgi:subtilisin family serine protease